MRKPRYDTRPGAAASATARLWIVVAICAFQYWLLTSSIEAWHGGNERIALPAFIASAICFLMGAGLILAGEIGAHKLEQDLKKGDAPNQAGEERG